ncbi:hypothetical protein EGM70_08405 [Enterobacteriaceae bacterium 89]|nr:hypothetical protein [Enterobacteriaceae bacterium 89]
MKYYLAAFSAIVMALLVVFIKPTAALDVRCEAEVVHTIETAENNIVLDAMASIFMMANGTGFVNLYGTLTDSKELWMVNRKVWFDWRNELNDNLYDISIHRLELKKGIDNAPAALMAKIYSQHFNMEIYSTGKNGLYFRGVSTPFFICARQNKQGKVT